MKNIYALLVAFVLVCTAGLAYADDNCPTDVHNPACHGPECHGKGCPVPAPAPPAPKLLASSVPGPTPLCNPYIKKCDVIREAPVQTGLAAMIMFGPGTPTPCVSGYGLGFVIHIDGWVGGAPLIRIALEWGPC